MYESEKKFFCHNTPYRRRSYTRDPALDVQLALERHQGRSDTRYLLALRVVLCMPCAVTVLKGMRDHGLHKSITLAYLWYQVDIHLILYF